ncbi:MAG: 50S ribosomal protein L11 methyltransferase [Acidobacteria bacterium]|nr:50S ribosomal protein L11 methyltransferase [Acidobacteriota bacterium]
MSLDRGTLLERLPELTVRLTPSGGVQIERDGEVLRSRGRALSILEAFSEPRTLEAALDILVPGSSAGKVEGLEVIETIFGMLNAGVLRRAGEKGGGKQTQSGSVSPVPSQIALLSDSGRTSSFLAAIAETVRPGDVVLDIGTGTGILAVAAARAGARRVYAVEAGEIAMQARAFIEGSGFADRVTLLRGWSYALSLPERADVLITETIGNDPLDERIVDVVSDARRRLLKDGARSVPRALTVFIQGFVIPEKDLEEMTFGPESVKAWRAAYGMDFEPVRRATDATLRRWSVDPHRAKEWPSAGDPVPLFEVTFDSIPAVPAAVEVELPRFEAGRAAGILLAFEVELSPSVRISTLPADVRPDNSWRSPIWLLPRHRCGPTLGCFRVEARRRIFLEETC